MFWRAVDLRKRAALEFRWGKLRLAYGTAIDSAIVRLAHLKRIRVYERDQGCVGDKNIRLIGIFAVLQYREGKQIPCHVTHHDRSITYLGNSHACRHGDYQDQGRRQLPHCHLARLCFSYDGGLRRTHGVDQPLTPCRIVFWADSTLMACAYCSCRSTDRQRCTDFS